MAERQPSKLHVAGSNPVSRSTDFRGDDPGRCLADASARLRAALTRTVRFDPALAATAEALSAAYRSGAGANATGPTDVADAADVGDERGHVHDGPTAAAYAATRMPATFTAIGRALTEGARALPGFAPRTLLDAGAGTAAATWSAMAVWPGIDATTLVEREPAMADLGRRLAAAHPRMAAAMTWCVEPLEAVALAPADLVIAAYVLGEIRGADRVATIGKLWDATATALVLVEPGSRAGFARILAARVALIEAGASIVAPCPGNVPCPVREPEWCHFLARLDRSPLHRRAKRAERSWEDEPYSYVVAVRSESAPAGPPEPAARVVLGRPRRRPGAIELRVCADGTIERVVRSRRDGAAYRFAADLAWGDRVPPDVRGGPPNRA